MLSSPGLKMLSVFFFCSTFARLLSRPGLIVLWALYGRRDYVCPWALTQAIQVSKSAGKPTVDSCTHTFTS